MRCPHPQHADSLTTLEDLVIHVLEHHIELENRMSLDLSSLTTAVTDTAAAISDAVSLMNSIAARLGAAGNSPDQSAINQLASNLETAAAGLKAATTADTPPPDAPGEPTPAPADPTPAQPTTPVQAVDVNGRPLYEFAGGDPATIDTTLWFASQLHAVNGEEIGAQLYTFSGDTDGNPTATGASPAWVPYTGTTV